MARVTRHFTAVAALVAITAYASSEVAAQQTAIRELAQIEKTGGTIDLEDTDGKEHAAVTAPESKLKDKDVVGVTLREMRNLEKALLAAGSLPKITSISVNYCWSGGKELTDTEVGMMIGVNSCKDRCLSLETLDLADCQVSPENLLRLRQLPALRTLNLRSINKGVTITDAHLEAIARIKTLKHLHLSPKKGKGTMPSEAAIAKLRKALPDCEIKIGKR